MSWHTVALDEVATIERSGVDPMSLDEETPYVGLEHIEAGGRLLEIKPVSNGELKSTKFAFGPDHILYGKLRPYLAKIALPGFEGICSTDILPILPGRRIDRNYLCHFLRQPAMIDYAASRAEGANLPRLSPRALAKFEIPLPPLDEQKRIAAILDKADQLRQKRRQTLALLDSLTQSIFLEMFGDPVSNPKGWKSFPLVDVADFMSGGTPSKSSPSFWVGQIPWISPKDMKSVIVRDSIDHISEKAIQHSAAKLSPAGSVLIVVRGMILAHTLPIAILDRQAAFNQDIKALLFRDSIAPRFGLWNMLVQASAILKQVSTAAHGTKRLDMESVANLPVLCPPIALQRKFAEQCARSEALREQSSRAIVSDDALFRSLQTSLFSIGSTSHER